MQRKGGVTIAFYSRTRDENKTNPQLCFYASLEGGRSCANFLLIASLPTEPQNTQLLHVVLSAQMGLKDIRGEILPCPYFIPVQEIPALHNLIVSFVCIFERALVSFAWTEVKNENDF